MHFKPLIENLGTTSEICDAAQFPCVEKSGRCDTQLMENLIRIIENCAQQGK